MAPDPEREASPTSDNPTELLELTFRGRTVSLVIRPPPEGTPPVGTDLAFRATRSAPLEKFPLELLVQAVKRPTGRPVVLGEVPVPVDVDGAWFITVSPDGLAAYAVPTAERGAGAAERADAESAVSPEPLVGRNELRDALQAADVTSGVLDAALERFAEPQPLADVICLARGTPPQPGRDASVEFAFDVDPPTTPPPNEDGSIDYHAAFGERFVESGAALARYQPPVEGTPGVDVRGVPLPPPPTKDDPLEGIAGANTEVRGEQLFATQPGRPLLNGQRVDVVATYEVPGDLDYSVGNLTFPGDVTVRGDVKPGFCIDATGSVTVQGVTDHATIRAGQDIVVRGVVGGDESVLEAGGDVVAQYLHGAHITAGGEVLTAREIVNCTVTARRVETPQAGRIVGGEIIAKDEVDTGALGSPKAVPTRVRAGEIGARPAQEPVVRARRAAYPGVLVQVGVAALLLTDDADAASFWAVGDAIVRLSAGANATDLADADAPDAPRTDAA